MILNTEQVAISACEYHEISFQKAFGIQSIILRVELQQIMQNQFHILYYSGINIHILVANIITY